uniref:NAD(P)-binding protein n=1 Tax=Plectus sambesii TaxID=2011161 RepID=A0A914VE82_9BILA
MAERTQQFTWRSTAEDVLKDIDLTGKTALITGTNSGIGIETARSLALHGAHVVMANRNIPASEKLRDEIIAEKPDAKVDILPIELSSLKSVKKAAEEYIAKGWPLHLLILNAGVAKPLVDSTEDDLEATYAVNHVAHFYLTQLLLPKLKQSAPSRVVIVSSELHSSTKIDVSLPVAEKIKILTPVAGTKEPGMFSFYAYSKLCNVLFAFALHRKAHQSGVNVYVVHPGVIKTGLVRGSGFLGKVFQFFGTPFFRSIEQGAATTVYCAADPELANVSGKYFENCWDDEKKLQKSLARDEALQDALWKHTEEFLRKFESSKM